MVLALGMVENSECWLPPVDLLFYNEVVAANTKTKFVVPVSIEFGDLFFIVGVHVPMRYGSAAPY